MRNPNYKRRSRTESKSLKAGFLFNSILSRPAQRAQRAQPGFLTYLTPTEVVVGAMGIAFSLVRFSKIRMVADEARLPDVSPAAQII